MSSDASRKMSADAAKGAYILHAGSGVSAGVRVSSLYRSFFSRLEGRLEEAGGATAPFTEMHRRVAHELGVDPLVDDVMVLFSMNGEGPSTTASIVAVAPIPSDRLETLSRQTDFLKRLDVQLPESARGADAGALPIYALRDDADVLMLTQPAQNVLVATTSVPNLADMILRARSNEAGDALEMDELMERVAGEDAWLYTGDVTGTFDRLRFGQAPPDIQRMLGSIRGLAASVRIENEHAVLTIYIEPRQGVATEDLSDLVRGLIAVLKLNTGDRSALTELAERIQVSDDGSFSRVQVEMGESEIEDLLMRAHRR